MSLPLKKLPPKAPMATEPAVLEERIQHIQSDVAELKQDGRRLDGKIDGVQADVNSLRKELGDFKADVARQFGEVRTLIAQLEAKMMQMESRMIRWTLGAIALSSSIAFSLAKLVH
jgi:predicted  nucleic acid-binding Zn-ribbon protein